HSSRPVRSPPPTNTGSRPLHDALPILSSVEDMTALTFTISRKGKTRTFVRAYLPQGALDRRLAKGDKSLERFVVSGHLQLTPGEDRKSTRLNSSHVKISYAVFCWNKKR